MDNNVKKASVIVVDRCGSEAAFAASVLNGVPAKRMDFSVGEGKEVGNTWDFFKYFRVGNVEENAEFLAAFLAGVQFMSDDETTSPATYSFLEALLLFIAFDEKSKQSLHRMWELFSQPDSMKLESWDNVFDIQALSKEQMICCKKYEEFKTYSKLDRAKALNCAKWIANMFRDEAECAVMERDDMRFEDLASEPTLWYITGPESGPTIAMILFLMQANRVPNELDDEKPVYIFDWSAPPLPEVII